VASRFAVETGQWDAVSVYPAANRTAELLFAQGMAGIAKGDTTTALRALTALNSLVQENNGRGAKIRASVIAANGKVLSAQLALFQKRFADAERFASEAVQYEFSTEFPSGPPDLIKPAYEFYGEVLLAVNKPTQAAEQFTISLKRMPNRALSLLGLARARVAQKDTAGATRAYRELSEIWAQADPTIPAVREVRTFLGIR
jgi:predicted Zn-dependent protease